MAIIFHLHQIVDLNAPSGRLLGRRDLTQAKAWYVFSVVSAARRALEFGRFRELKPPARSSELSLLGVERPKGPGKLSPAQGLPWETRSNVTSPEVASGISGRGSSAPRQRTPLQGIRR